LLTFIDLFKLGTKHIIPPIDVSDSEINNAFYKFKHKILWQLYHHRILRDANDTEEIDDDTSIFVGKLKPPKRRINPCNFIQQNHRIHDILANIGDQLRQYITENPATRKTNPSTRAIHLLLSKFKEVIFKPADKNLGLVAIHISHYDQLIMDHLSVESNYRLCASDSITQGRLLENLKMKFEQFRLNTFWNQNERPLIKFQWDFSFPKFHILPKLHKTGPVKGRPIAGQVSWITTPVSKILDHRLQSCLREYPCILKNSFQLVEELDLLNDTDLLQNENIRIITGDIESLYPNIDIQKLVRLIDDLDITSGPLCEFVCENSYVTYNNKVYQQLQGIPMGTNAAVTLANLYVGSLIDRFIESRPDVIYYKRYIDDLFIIWKGSLDSWNRCAAGIARMLNIPIHWDPPSQTHGNFLDVQLNRNPYDGKIWTSVYQKHLNKYMYLTPTSTHAPHMFSGFIKGELTRYARLCSTPFTYEGTKRLFKKRLIQRGYSRALLNAIFSKHKWNLRFASRERSGERILPFVLPYTLRRNVGKIQSIIYRHADQIQEFFDYSKVMMAYSKRPNIYQMLCPSAITRSQSQLLLTRSFRYASRPASGVSRM
jgi:hypothetical protein